MRQLIVCDTHHGGGNIVMERMLQDTRITYLGRSVGNEGSERRWMPGLDHTVDAFMFPGRRAKAGTPDAFFSTRARSPGRISASTVRASARWESSSASPPTGTFR